MSYDLFLRPRPPYNHDSIRAYFQSRRLYRIHENQTQVFYSNPDTSVCFSFDLQGSAAPGTSSDHFAVSDSFPVAFNMNYYRPHFFGLEAEPELTAFVRHFAADIHDPQMHGMADGPYTPEGFLTAWNAGNAVGYKAILQLPSTPSDVSSLPSAELRKIWQWNYQLSAEQARRGEGIFVPRIMAFASTASPLTFAVWPEGAPIYLPHTDVIVLHRLYTAAAGSGEKGDTAFVPWETMVPLISEHRIVAESPVSFDLYHIATFSLALRDFFNHAAPNRIKQRGIRLDEILDRELVLQFRPTSH